MVSEEADITGVPVTTVVAVTAVIVVVVAGAVAHRLSKHRCSWSIGHKKSIHY
jgi:hypothetical protein